MTDGDRFDELRKVLLLTRNADGGWGYYPGKASRLEPTCWSLLALRDVSADVLRHWPGVDDLLLERRNGQPNYGFHAVALLTLLVRGVEHESGNMRLLRKLEQAKGIRHEPSTINRQDHRVQGWSWIAETSSWVEPTAWALLALKKWSRAPGTSIDAERIGEAEALLIDRCCVTGGWNYGNSNMLGRELKPYVPTTAATLLSLQDRHSQPAVNRSAVYLERASTSELSSVALSLAILALRVLGRKWGAAREALLAQLRTTLALRNHLGIALTLIALGTDDEKSAVVV